MINVVLSRCIFLFVCFLLVDLVDQVDQNYKNDQGPWQGNRAECDIPENFASNEYMNIFVSTKLHERISEYIRITNLTQTIVRINICIENCTNIRIYSNIQTGFTL